MPLTGITIRPPSATCSTSSSGSSRGSAETSTRSYGASVGQPKCQGRPARSVPTAGRAAARLARPNSTSVGSSSTPMTAPVGPVRWASSAVVQPDPDPTSRTRSPLAHLEQPQHRLHRPRLGVGLAAADLDRAVVGRPPASQPREEPGARSRVERLGHPVLHPPECGTTRTNQRQTAAASGKLPP